MNCRQIGVKFGLQKRYRIKKHAEDGDARGDVIKISHVEHIDVNGQAQ